MDLTLLTGRERLYLFPDSWTVALIIESRQCLDLFGRLNGAHDVNHNPFSVSAWTNSWSDQDDLRSRSERLIDRLGFGLRGCFRIERV